MKSLVLCISFFLLTQAVGAQYSLAFCEDVSDGKAVNPSNSFMVNKDGSAVKLLLKCDEKIKTPQMDFRIFYINDNGKEQEIERMPAKVTQGWNYVWKELVFFDAGNYRVKVYNSSGAYLTSANLNVRQ